MFMDIGGCLIRMQEMLDSLSPKEQQLARFIIAQPENVVSMSIDELATSCGVSTSTVIRLCKNLRYSGFKDLCRSLCCDLSTGADVDFEDIMPGDVPENVMRNICLSTIRAIENTMALANSEDLNRAVDALCRANRIDFYGMGTSGMVAVDAGNKFTRINKTVIAHSDPHNQILSALTLRAKDVAVLISYSGETSDILNVAEEIKKQGTTIITLTQYSKNSLAAMGDINLYCVSTETLLRSGAMSSRIAQLTVIDTLYASVCSRMFDKVKSHLDRTRAITQRTHIRG